MAAGAVLNVSVGRMAGGEGGVEEDGVVVLDYVVVLAVDEEDGRTVVGDVAFEREGVAHGLPSLAVLTEQCAPRAFVHYRLRHRHYGVYGCHEVRAQRYGVGDAQRCEEVRVEELRHGHDEVASGTEPHGSHACRVHIEKVGVLAYVLYGTLSVLYHLRVLVAAGDVACVHDVVEDTLHAVVEDEGGDAVAAEPARHHGALRVVVVPAVAAAGTYYHGWRGGWPLFCC